VEGGARPRVEDFLTREPEPARGALLRDLLIVELAYRRQRHEEPTAAEYGARFPGFAAVIATCSIRRRAPSDLNHTAPRPAGGSGSERGSPTGT